MISVLFLISLQNPPLFIIFSCEGILKKNSIIFFLETVNPLNIFVFSLFLVKKLWNLQYNYPGDYK